MWKIVQQTVKIVNKSENPSSASASGSRSRVKSVEISPKSSYRLRNFDCFDLIRFQKSNSPSSANRGSAIPATTIAKRAAASGKDQWIVNPQSRFRAENYEF